LWIYLWRKIERIPPHHLCIWFVRLCERIKGGNGMKTRTIVSILIIVLTVLFATLLIMSCTGGGDNGGNGGDGSTPVEVGGIIDSDTTWEEGDYRITETVQVPDGVTLTIAPGTLVDMPLAGVFSAKASDGGTFLDLAYCEIRNGLSFWPATGYQQYGSFSLLHSNLHDLHGEYLSYVWYPDADVHIEYNIFTNTGGFSVGTDEDRKVYIRYNRFDGKYAALPDHADYWVENWAAYDSSATIVSYNSFLNTSGIALSLASGHDSAAMKAPENYWGTTDTNKIEEMIYDKSDDITCAGYIEYQPILTSPDPIVP
jgi:hypothetical protein